VTKGLFTRIIRVPLSVFICPILVMVIPIDIFSPGSKKPSPSGSKRIGSPNCSFGAFTTMLRVVVQVLVPSETIISKGTDN